MSRLPLNVLRQVEYAEAEAKLNTALLFRFDWTERSVIFVELF